MSQAETYTIAQVQELLNLQRTAIVSMISSGFLTPARGSRNEYRFTFQDVVILRTAHRLTEQNLPLRRVVQSLKKLRERLPAEVPLSGLRITAMGGDVAVRASDAQWEAPSGQVLIDFEVSAGEGGIHVVSQVCIDGAGPVSAEHHFRTGHRLQETDPIAAEAAYRAALAIEASHYATLLNLGALLCRHGHCDDAAELYERALEVDANNADLHFNYAIALEDQKRYASAIKAYERVLELAPDFADAHYNVGLLYDKTGEPQKALRHINTYRRTKRG